MIFLLSTLLAIPIFGQLLRVPLFDRIGLMPSDLFVIIILFVWFIKNIQNKTSLFPVQAFHKQIFWPIFAFFGWAIISLTINIGYFHLNFSESFQAFAYYGRYLSYVLLIFVFLTEMKNIKVSENFWKYLLYIPAFCIALLGFAQLEFFPSFFALGMHEQGWDPHIGRLLSTWFDPNLLGGYFAFILSILAGDIWNMIKNQSLKKRSTSRIILLSFFFFTILIALALTFSRGSYLAFIISGFIFTLFVEKRLLVIGAILLTLLVSFSPRAQERIENAAMSAQALFTQTEKTLDPTSRLRVQSWSIGIKLFQENPVFGVGFNTLKSIQKREWAFMSNSHAGSGIDASFLTVLATTGLIGIMSFLWIWTHILQTAWRKFRQNNNIFAFGVFSGISGLFAHAVFVNSLLFNLLLPSLFLAIALVLKKEKYT